MSRNPEGRGSIPRLGGRRSSLISNEHAELLRSTPSLVHCCVWLVTMALHVHWGLGQLSPLPTSGDDKWVAAKHCGRAKRSRISDTHRLRSSFQFRYINNQSLLHFLLFKENSDTSTFQQMLFFQLPLCLEKWFISAGACRYWNNVDTGLAVWHFVMMISLRNQS